MKIKGLASQELHSNLYKLRMDMQQVLFVPTLMHSQTYYSFKFMALIFVFMSPDIWELWNLFHYQNGRQFVFLEAMHMNLYLQRPWTSASFYTSG